MTLSSLTIAFLTLPLTNPVAIFLVVLCIILLAPLLLNRLKIPYLIGMIIAGMIVGPYGFHVLERDASFQIFGQVGILYLMFLAAVEIDMFHLRANLEKGLIFGLLTSVLPLCIGVLACRYILHTGWDTAALIASMYASHTLISYPIVSRLGLSNARSVVIGVTSTIVAVMLALLVLAQVVAFRTQGDAGFSGVVWLLAKMAVYGVVVGYGFPWLTRWFFRSINEMVWQFIFVLSLVFVASLLASIIGLEAILGAFFAGLVLNRFIPARSSLMNHIEFVGNAIFIPYFLIGVGMLINVGVIFKGWNVWWIALNMIVVALGCKWLAAFCAQKLFHFTRIGRRMLFGLTSGKAAATIAATMVGFQYGLLSEDMMNSAVIMILVCCAMASLVTQRAALKLRINITDEELRKDNVPERRNSRQLVAVAHPLTAEGLMRIAVFMRHPLNDIPITTLFIRNNDNPSLLAMGKNALKAAAEVATGVDIQCREIERYDLNVVAGITNVMKEHDCSDIIIGLHRKTNIVDTFYGSMIESLLVSTNRMIIMSRCFAPVNTLSRLVVVVPEKAEYETGFPRWVERIGNMSQQLGCKAVFMAYKVTIPYIKGVLSADGYQIRDEYEEMDSWDDFIMLSNKITEEDLIIIIGARRSSISFSSDLENLPNFLQRYYSRHNLLVIYPEQFGNSPSMPTPIDPLAGAVSVNPSPILLSLSRLRQMFHID